MKKKRYIAYFLFFISMVMLVVPVIPHHHHDNGLICMKNDLPAQACCHQHQDACKDHCCCDTGCMTTHFFQQAPSTDHIAMHPDLLWVTILFSEPILNLLSLPEDNGIGQTPVYVESLHGTFITHATGLRAPPCA